MLKNVCLSVLLGMLFTFVFLGVSFAQEENMVKGTVEEISQDGTYIVVSGQKIITTPEFLEESLLEVGDKVEITIEKTDKGLKAINYNYVFEEEETTAEPTKEEPVKIEPATQK